jgi:hypothetical protein
MCKVIYEQFSLNPQKKFRPEVKEKLQAAKEEIFMILFH